MLELYIINVTPFITTVVGGRSFKKQPIFNQCSTSIHPENRKP